MYYTDVCHIFTNFPSQGQFGNPDPRLSSRANSRSKRVASQDLALVTRGKISMPDSVIDLTETVTGTVVALKECKLIEAKRNIYFTYFTYEPLNYILHIFTYYWWKTWLYKLMLLEFLSASLIKFGHDSISGRTSPQAFAKSPISSL